MTKKIFSFLTLILATAAFTVSVASTYTKTKSFDLEEGSYSTQVKFIGVDVDDLGLKAGDKIQISMPKGMRISAFYGAADTNKSECTMTSVGTSKKLKKWVCTVTNVNSAKHAINVTVDLVRTDRNEKVDSSINNTIELVMPYTN